MAQSATDPVNPLHRVSDRALRWHFEQAILKNVPGGTGERWVFWEHDFGEGEDVIRAIMEGPDGSRRMELELANRLGEGDDAMVGE